MAEAPKNTNDKEQQEKPENEISADFLNNPAFLTYLASKNETGIISQLEDLVSKGGKVGEIKSDTIKRAHEHHKEFQKETQKARNAVTPELIEKIAKHSPELKSVLEQGGESGKSHAEQITQQLEILFSTNPDRYHRIIDNLEKAAKYDKKETTEQIDDFCDKHNIPTKEFRKSLESDKNLSDEALKKIIKKRDGKLKGLYKRASWKLGEKLDISYFKMNMGVEKVKFEGEIDELREKINQDIKDLGELLYASLYAEEQSEEAAEAFAENLPRREEAEPEAEIKAAEEEKKDMTELRYESITDELSDLQAEYEESKKSKEGIKDRRNKKKKAERERLEKEEGSENEEEGKVKKKRESTPPPIPEEARIYEPTDEELIEEEKDEEELKRGTVEFAEKQVDGGFWRKRTFHKDEKGRWFTEREIEEDGETITIKYIVDNKSRKPDSDSLDYYFSPAKFKEGKPATRKPKGTKNLELMYIRLEPPFPEKPAEEKSEAEKIADEFLQDEEDAEETPETEAPAAEPDKEELFEEIEEGEMEELTAKGELTEINKLLNASDLGKIKNIIIQNLKEGEYDKAIKILSKDEYEGKFNDKIFGHIENLKALEETSEESEKDQKMEEGNEDEKLDEVFDLIEDFIPKLKEDEEVPENIKVFDDVVDSLDKKRYEQAINLLRTEFYSQEDENQDKIKNIIFKIIDLDPDTLGRLRSEFE